ncbi:MAG: Fe-S cluster assembly protein IscX [Anaerolineales bacterium]|uniref:Fe-S cluster assembly protein IscX n=1 Tax=Promineifilum sp. TaxID=2664178 RepID=UPI001DFA84B0|nr:Fe-S cluster assembly protein IscX [Anaerolineales bacterium]MCB8935131.1 Fe-S cluster assembly protein IscX [Promineifilum sp.]MCO5179138.1 Fe-S cluster assembly protein IscX [Promineifilum sp.]
MFDFDNNSTNPSQSTILMGVASRANALSDHEPELYWDSTYAIVVSLMEHYPDRPPTEVGLEELVTLVESLPGYRDDSALVNEQLLMDILTVWYEEATTL